MATNGDLKCHRCPVCDGYGCPGMLPGLGGVFEGKNFQLNYEGWKELYNLKKEEISKIALARIFPATKKSKREF